MNEWVLKDQIKRGFIKYNVGDEVTILTRKKNGHPRGIKDGITYIVKSVDLDGHLMVAQHSSDGVGFLQPIRVHKMYMMNKSLLRDIKLNSILGETK
jgi:hypothetical protein